MPKTRSVQAESTHYAYVTLHNAAGYALDAAEATELGRFFNCLSAMLYSAFSLEAYLNHIGESEFDNWAKITRYKSPAQKLQLLADKKKQVLDMSRPPFDAFSKMFEFRKMLVHAKTEHVHSQGTQEGEPGELPVLPTTQWEAATTLSNARRFVKSSASMIQALHPIFGYSSKPFSTEWKASWSAHPADTIP